MWLVSFFGPHFNIYFYSDYKTCLSVLYMVRMYPLKNWNPNWLNIGFAEQKSIFTYYKDHPIFLERKDREEDSSGGMSIPFPVYLYYLLHPFNPIKVEPSD